MKHIRIGRALPLLVAFLVAEPLAASRTRSFEMSLAENVRNAIVDSPRYGPFDLIRIEVKGHTVVLGGVVVPPTLKAEAAEAARSVPGVTRVVNSIEILPLSFDDARLRRAVFLRIYRDDMLSRYGTPVTGPWFHGFASGASSRFEPLGTYAIHVVVERGHVTLYGIVDRDADRLKATFDARSVFGVKSVENRLVVRGETPHA